MKRDLLSYLLAFIILVGGAFGLYKAWTFEGETYYQGIAVCETEQDYVQLKRDFAKDGVLLQDAVVLASEPPILVKFKVEVPSSDYAFPYGERVINGWFSKGAGGLFQFYLLVFLFTLCAFLPIFCLHSKLYRWRE
jgi:hypothetical protein